MESRTDTAAAEGKLRDSRFTTFGLERRSAFTWLGLLLLAASLAANIVYFACGGSFGRCLGGWRIPLLVVLPACAVVFFIAEALVHGRDRLYKTSFPVLLGALYFVFRAICLFKEGGSFVNGGLVLAACILLAFAAFLIWELTVNAMRLKSKFIAAALFLAAFALVFVFETLPVLKSGAGFSSALSSISASAMLAGMFLCSAGLKAITGEYYRPRRGDRCDGRLIRSLDPMNGFALYIMPNRNGAATYYSDSFECSRAEEYIRRKRSEGLDGFGMMHLIAAAYVRVISQRPAANRFISGQKIYTRDGELELAMVVKKELTADAPETVIKVNFSPEDTPEDVYRKFSEQVQSAKDTPLDSSFDNLAWLLNAVPGILKKFMVWLLKTLDYFGFLPRFLMRLSPFHGSIFITALGSLGIPPVFHHLYDFGNIPIFVAFGARRTETETDENGGAVHRKYMDYTIVSDERICDGFYYASAIKMFRRFLNNPDKLDAPPAEIFRDVY